MVVVAVARLGGNHHAGCSHHGHAQDTQAIRHMPEHYLSEQPRPEQLQVFYRGKQTLKPIDPIKAV